MSPEHAKVPVSVIVPIRNEAKNLPRCLESVRWADEIFVVDSQSTDGSIEIAQKHGAKVEQFQFNGTWPKKKNRALENLPLRNEWVLFSQPGMPLVPAKIVIGDDAFIGARAFVLPGVTVGARAVIGACSVVTHDVPSDVIAAGNPCRVLRKR